ncbi:MULTISPECIES: molybdopterin-dependent oxidoreductase [Sphingomonadales]|uniref:Oxidase n=1 Tax=Tsuneonella suprasediminis TaxID=2306996 RepID=A0A419R3D7_9SPHN|nr:MULTISPECIES: molybdopterin-dependent oxidoreductase [Sphingomonadales]MAM37425.1 oxidase [Erythrobacter sp.]RJX69047.1 oxidase [Tsuneonella suprasediminis]|tara:strand:- start:5687 stop:6925 length:1239 start_codon:yes stop_codon:yes gene_type:complete
MKSLDGELATETSRRRFLAQAVLGTAGFAAAPALAQQLVDLHLPGGNSDRPVTDAFPGKGRMILQRIHPPLLETPMEVFDKSVFTPNDQFYVRWHWADIPTSINVDSFRLEVSGHVDKPISISLDRLLSLPRIEYAAVNQCSGNSRGLFVPRVPGAQWGNGAMGNAKWLGVSLRSVLDLAGVRPGAAQVRFGGLDQPVVPDGPDYFKSLAIDHARDGEVMIAFGMNGEQLPLLNGFPCRLIVPGWYSTYWVKMLSSIEVLPGPDDKYWMAKAYKIPDTPRADVKPGATGYKTVPINKMVPRSWVTSLGDGQAIAYEPTIPLGGIAMGGDCGVARVAVSADGGRSWYQTQLGPDEGKYSFRRWDARVPLPGPGSVKLMSRCWNTDGVSQPMQPIWNSGGYMRGNIEITTIVAS